MLIEDFYVNDQEKSDVGKFEGNLWESSSFSKLHCMLHRIIVSLCSVYHCVSLYHCIFVSLYHYITVYHCITVSLYHCIFLKLQCIIVSLCSLCIIVSLYHCIFLKLHCIITLCFVHFVPQSLCKCANALQCLAVLCSVDMWESPLLHKTASAWSHATRAYLPWLETVAVIIIVIIIFTEIIIALVLLQNIFPHRDRHPSWCFDIETRKCF